MKWKIFKPTSGTQTRGIAVTSNFSELMASFKKKYAFDHLSPAFYHLYQTIDILIHFHLGTFLLLFPV